MKILTVTVPCYNSEDYLDRCVESLLPGGNDIEIILVDDGSTDRTPAIADSYAEKYPDIIRVVHKENGGHGSTINTGIREASGMFFKVVDSDDRLGEEALEKTLAFLRECIDEQRSLDMFVTNYVYDKAGAVHKYVMKPKGLPAGRLLSWSDVHHIKKYHFILMHSIIYRTEVLRSCGFSLPEHTFYVDNIYAFSPFPYVKNFWYMDIDLYWYYIGREGQSVSEENVVKRIDQYIRVIKIMAEKYIESQSVTDERSCLDYMLNYLEMCMAIVCTFLNVGDSEEYEAKRTAMWHDIAEMDPELAKTLHHRIILLGTNLPGHLGRMIGVKGYHIASKIFGLN